MVQRTLLEACSQGCDPWWRNWKTLRNTGLVFFPIRQIIYKLKRTTVTHLQHKLAVKSSNANLISFDRVPTGGLAKWSRFSSAEFWQSKLSFCVNSRIEKGEIDVHRVRWSKIHFFRGCCQMYIIGGTFLTVGPRTMFSPSSVQHVLHFIPCTCAPCSGIMEP